MPPPELSETPGGRRIVLVTVGSWGDVLPYLAIALGLRERGHRAILAPKFQAVVDILRARLGDYGVASWTEPKGGYFVSLDVVDGTASRVIQLAREAGVAMTPAGAAFPYGADPRDRNIRIAPSYPSPEELAAAIDVLATCVLIAACEQALAQ